MRMTPDQLFASLDLDDDGQLSREDLGGAARALGWHWPQSRLYAVLDRLCLAGPLDRAAFHDCLECMASDPLGPFGQVLLRAHGPPVTDADGAPDAGGPPDPCPRGTSVVELLDRTGHRQAADDLRAAMAAAAAAPVKLSTDRGAMLLIDPQRSFTRGSWAESLGPDGGDQVAPIALAFARCARLLGGPGPRPDVMFTRCPFPPESYDWDEAIAAVLPGDQPYFVKPGNSVLWPPTNGFEDWTRRQLDHGRSALVIGGCTLNSCVRVSASETQRLLGPAGLQVIVDLGLAGARQDNYLRSPQFGDRSSVAAAIEEMRAEGVTVTTGVTWQD